MTYKKQNLAAGFTLIELSVVMVIIGLLAVAGLNLYTTYNKQHVITSTGDNIKAAQAALQKYQDDNGFYPCPADPTDPLGRATNCALPAPPGIKVVTGTAGREVRIGAMPILDMSGETKLIQGSQAVDGWRRRLSYAVTQSMAVDPTQFVSGNGAITVQDAQSGTNLTTNGNILVLSHGEDGSGGYNTNGIQVGTCPSGTKDAENCNDDAVFVSGQRSFAFGTSYNDDFIEYNTATAVETTKSCPAGSILRGLKSNGDLICTKDLSCPAGSAFTGLLADGETANCQTVTSACGPTEALVSMTLGSAPVCIRNMPGDCPVGYVQNGTIATEGPTFGQPNCLQILTSCPTNYVQVGTNANHSPICVPNFNSSCPGGQIQIGNDNNGSAVCKNIDLNACPGGQYMYGMNNGSPLCSGDRNVNDGNCPPGQVMTGINGSVVTCSAVNMTPGECTVYLNPTNDFWSLDPTAPGFGSGGYGSPKSGPDKLPGTGMVNANGEWVTSRTRTKPAYWDSKPSNVSFGEHSPVGDAHDGVVYDSVTKEWMCVNFFGKPQPDGGGSSGSSGDSGNGGNSSGSGGNGGGDGGN